MSDLMDPTREAVADFGSLAFEVIHQLRQEIRELEEKLDERDKELALARLALDSYVGRH